MRRAVALLFSFGFLLFPIRGPEPLLGQGMLEEVTRVKFQGNRIFPDEVLVNAIITRQTECRSFILLPFCWAGADFSKDPYFLQPREFRRDQARLRLFYYQRGYREASVDTLLNRALDGEVEITFQIQEGSPVRVVEVGFTGLEEIPDSAVLEDLPIRMGDPLNALMLEASRDSLTTRLRDRGFAHAEVLLNYSIPREFPLEARVTFDLFPGPAARVGPISVVGNTAVSERVVRRMLPFREGHLFNATALLTGRRNLYNLDIFTRANIVPDLAYQPDSIVPLRVEVGEGDLHRVRAGAGFSGAECVNTEARWASRNFFGGARRLQVTGRVSNLLTPFLENSLCKYSGTGDYGELNWLLSADFTQPWLFSPRNAVSAGIFAERQSLPDIFIRQTIGVNLALSHTFTLGTPITFSYRPQLSSLDAAGVFLCSNYLVCTLEDIEILQDRNWLSPLGLRLSQDRRNQVLSPTRGHAALVDLEYGATWTGSDFGYVRALAEGSWYTQSRSRLVVATRLRAGWVSAGAFDGALSPGASGEIIHPDKRLYAGGSNSVRGFAQNRLGPKVLYVQNVEKLLNPVKGKDSEPCAPEEINDLTCDAGFLPDQDFATRPTGGTSLIEGSMEFRFPVRGQLWEGAAFVDFGQVWEEDLGVDLRGLELTPGMGIRYLSPIGPIRVDLAYRFDDGERLQVVTSQVRPFDVAAGDLEKNKLVGPDGPIDWVASNELALLSPLVLWGNHGAWSLRRFQLHLSIGQAF
jgi:outer membrane protein insertion porin family/translocation and assembly module TamA